MPNNDPLPPPINSALLSPLLNVGSSLSSPAPAGPPPPQPTEPQAPAHELPAYELLGHLPESYGTKKLFLVARDPYILFAYWDLNRDQYKAAASDAHDGKVFLEVYVPGEGRVQQIHVWDSHKNWYLQVNRPDTQFVAQIGYYRADGRFEVLARSAEVHTPRDTLSPDTGARFVTLPFQVSFRELADLVTTQTQPGEELADTLSRLQRSDFELPFQARVPSDLTAQQTQKIVDLVGDEEVRRRMVGSFEITEILKKRFEAMVSSGLWNSSGGGGGAWPTSVSSPFGASFGRERGFHMHVNAELIIYGGTEPTAKVRIEGHDISLSKDGTFSYHFVFPDGNFHIPISATSADGVETRTALLSFLRVTELEGDVRKTAQPVTDEPLGRQE